MIYLVSIRRFRPDEAPFLLCDDQISSKNHASNSPASFDKDWSRISKKDTIFLPLNARVVKLVDTLDLGSSVARRGGSSPSSRTIIKPC